MDMEVDAEEDQPPQENGQDGARDRAEPAQAEVAVIPGDYDADDQVERDDQPPDALVRHASLPSEGKCLPYKSHESGHLNQRAGPPAEASGGISGPCASGRTRPAEAR